MEVYDALHCGVDECVGYRYPTVKLLSKGNLLTTKAADACLDGEVPEL